MTSPHQQHRRASRQIVAGVAILTFSDTRTVATDKSGQAIADRLSEAGHTVAAKEIVREVPDEVTAAVLRMLERDDVDAIITTGGTGVAPRDNTVSAVMALLDVPLPGFGELFRMLSWEQVGSAAMLSRAVAGIAGGKPIFSLPGSTQAVELAMSKLILPELAHLLHQLRK